jgi:hypothetical protein
MNHFLPFAQVSALDHPLPETLQKRQFTPATGTIFGDSRRRKLENGVQAVKTSAFSGFQSGWQDSSDFGQDSTFQSSRNNSLQGKNLEKDVKSSERQKFRARPIPRSLYQPFTLQKPVEKQVTVPQQFNLTSPSPKKPLMTQVETFRARPMPDFSKPWQPCITPKKGKTFEEVSRQGFSNSCLKHSSSFQREEPALVSLHSRSHSKGSFVSNGLKESTGFMEIELHSTKRAKDREMFQERLKELERARIANLEEEARLKAMQDEEEMKVIRKQAEFKARPMPYFKRVLDWNNDNHLEDRSTDFASSTNDTMMDIEY